MSAASLVSIVMPVYNGEPFIAEAIESALAQDHEPVEVVVVDDGSTDRSGAIAEAAGVRVIRRDNGGPAAARNSGLAVCAGEFVTFLDADDVMLPTKVGAQLAPFLADDALGGVVGRMETFLEPGVPEERLDPASAWSPDSHTLGTSMFRRTVFETVGLFDERYRVGEDLDMLVRMRRAEIPFLFVDDVVLRRRLHGANLTYDLVGHAPMFVRSLKNSLDLGRRDPG